MRWWTPGIPVLLVAALFAACGGDDDDDGGGGGSGTQTLGSTTFNVRGTGDARGKPELDLEAGNFYFSPTFVRGEPGKEVTLRVANESGTKHNISVAGAEVDTDIDANGKGTVTLKVPADGVVLFFCKYHAGSGMNGEVLAGDTSPAAVSQGASPAAGGGSPTAAAGSTGGSYDPY